MLFLNNQGRRLLVNTKDIPAKATRSTQGVQVMTLRKNGLLMEAQQYREGMLEKPDRYRKAIPAAGALPSAEELQGEQMKLE